MNTAKKYLTSASSRTGFWLSVLLPLVVVSAIFLNFYLMLGTPKNAQLKSIWISEIMVKNLSGILGADGQPVSWIELYNPTESDLSLSGMGLSNKKNDPYRCLLPDITLESKKHLLIYADGLGYINGNDLHTSFTLARNGGSLFITSADGTLLDRLNYPTQYFDIPYGRLDWDGIAQGYLAAATPNSSNPASFWGGQDITPSKVGNISFSVPSGSYVGSFTLYLSCNDTDALILYTTDGSEPNIGSSFYTQKGISIRDDRNQSSDSPSCTVVRARLYKEGHLSEEIQTQSYFICSKAKHFYPPISISTTSDLLFDKRYGLMEYGSTATRMQSFKNIDPLYVEKYSNYMQNTSVPVAFEQFNTNGSSILNENGSLRLSGMGSRRQMLKSMIINLDNGSSLKLRTQQDHWDVPLTSPYLNHMWSNAFLDLGIFSPSCDFFEVYINGEYWGIFSLQATTTDIICNASGLKKDNLYIVKTSDVNFAVAGGQSALDSVEQFYQGIITRDFRRSKDYEWLKEQMDMDEFIRYILAEFYIENNDFGTNNIGLWRSIESSNISELSDGRWRWIIYDLDHTCGAAHIDLLNVLVNIDFLDESISAEERIMQLETTLDQLMQIGSSRILRVLLCKLWLSPEFQEQIWEAAQDVYSPNGFYSSENIQDIIHEHYLELEPALPRHFNHLYGKDADVNMTRWKNSMDHISQFANERTDYMLWFIRRSCFLLNDQ